MLLLLTHDLPIEFLTTTREDLLDVLSSFGRCLEALVDVVLFGEFDGAVEIDLAGGLKLAFVSD